MPEIIAFIISFAVALALGPAIIRALKQKQFGQAISEDAPESHQKKTGTPTMGGLIIITAIALGIIPAFSAGLININMIAVLALMAAYSILGLVDDYLTIKPINNIRGISSKPKSVLQFLIATGFVIWMSHISPNGRLEAFNCVLLTGIWYQIFAVLFIVGIANFVNITDGLDGLVSGLTCAALLPLIIFSIVFRSHFIILDAAIVGACLGFLWFNANPAKVFMGDTGSLAIGAALPAIALMTSQEMVLIIAGLVFILDGLSTAIQWAYFKYTRIKTGTGKRIFKKSPVHHHFELSGWSEQTVVVRFWIIGVMSAALAIIIKLQADSYLRH